MVTVSNNNPCPPTSGSISTETEYLKLAKKGGGHEG